MARSIAGIVLAGGKSERMGQNKALLAYRGRPMVEHMKQILIDARCTSIYISGTVSGYDTLPDDQVHEGPARAISGLLRRFRGKYDALLFVPVDMPLLIADDLLRLISVGNNACYVEHPLPVIIATESGAPDSSSVHGLLEETGVVTLKFLPGQEERMLNANTPDEWRKVLP